MKHPYCVILYIYIYLNILVQVAFTSMILFEFYNSKHGGEGKC